MITPERQAQVNALYNQKARRGAERLRETLNLKAKLASTERVTRELLSLLKEREPNYAQPPPRRLSIKAIAACDALPSQDSWRVKQDADKERHALA